MSRLEAENERLKAQIKAEESRFGGGGYEMNRVIISLNYVKLPP